MNEKKVGFRVAPPGRERLSWGVFPGLRLQPHERRPVRGDPASLALGYLPLVPPGRLRRLCVFKSD